MFGMITGFFVTGGVADFMGIGIGSSIGNFFDFTSIIGVTAAFVALITLSISYRAIRKSSLSDIEINSELVREDIQSLRKRIERAKDEEVSNRLREQEKVLREELDERLKNNLRDELTDNSDDWKIVLLAARKRLIEETGRLSARSRGSLNIALLLSFVMMIFLVFLIYYTLNYGGPKDLISLLTRYGPFVTLFLLVQILAGFFLKMFAQNEADIQKNKNEITNVELRLTAGVMVSNSKTNLAKLSDKLISEERNFVLNKKEKSSLSGGAEQVSELLKTIQTLAKK